MRDGRLNDSSSVSIHHLGFGPHCHIPGVHTGSGRIWELRSLPSARYRDMGKLKFYDDTTDDCMCPLRGTYVPRAREILLSFRRNSFPDIGLNFRARFPYLHRTCERNGDRILLRTRHPHEHFSSDFWCGYKSTILRA